MTQLGKYNALTDVDGIRVGHHTDLDAACGVTVVICPEGAVAGVDVRGSAPGTRETDLLAPTNLVEKAQAVVLSGGSVYGLAASDGVVRWLSGKGHGFPVGRDMVAPIVPAAVLFDLGRGKDSIPPIGPDWGIKACEAASDGTISMGSVGAGTGAMSGGIKGGLGTASLILASGITVSALAATNSFGSTIDPATGRIWEARMERDGEFGRQGGRAVVLPVPPVSGPARNTTIAVVATDATLTKSQAQKVAQMAHDGMARAIRPAHTMFDGDTVFCLATGARTSEDRSGAFSVPGAPMISNIGHAAADCLTRAIIHGIVAASSLGNMTAFRDLSDR
jgi:L-aminopeptidase/D-esterase-like protein